MLVAWHPAVHEQIKYLAERFPSRLMIHVGPLDTPAQWQKFSELSNVEAVRFNEGDDEALSHLATFVHLRLIGCQANSHVAFDSTLSAPHYGQSDCIRRNIVIHE